MAKKCPECSEVIRGRADKRFCSDACRNSFHNKSTHTSSVQVRSINSILKRNRRILQEMLPAEKTQVSRAQLLKKGFNPMFFTSMEQGRKGPVYYCYEFGFVQQSIDHFILMRIHNVV